MKVLEREAEEFEKRANGLRQRAEKLKLQLEEYGKQKHP